MSDKQSARIQQRRALMLNNFQQVYELQVNNMPIKRQLEAIKQAVFAIELELKLA